MEAEKISKKFFVSGQIYLCLINIIILQIPWHIIPQQVQEIWDQLDGKITHFIAGIGTSGTVMGSSKYLKEKNEKIKVIAVQPDNSLHGLEGLKLTFRLLLSLAYIVIK